MSESQFEQFETRSPYEVAPLVELAETFLPQEAELKISADNYLSSIRSYEFKNEVPGSDVLGGCVQRIIYDNGADILAVLIGKWSPSSDVIITKNSTLVLSNGRFLVKREANDISVISENEPPAVNIQEQNDQGIVEYGLGLMMPDTSDWEEYVSSLHTAKSYYEKYGQNQGHFYRASRLTNLFSKFRRK